MSANSYNSDKPPAIDIDYASDPASGSFFNTEFKKNEDLKQMLDSNKDSLKLEAMKRIIGMVAKGKDASDLFPAVVKNVVSANLEVKKLVYVYLVRYAEEQQDLALLSISTFQRALKDPNPLIRACALRVLSSIRVTVIVPIMMLAIKETVTDLSPYVRKTTAHAIPKLYSLDPDQKDELVKVIEKLLSDMSTLVVGSTVMAFEEVCPERIDLIHGNYRKLCCLLVDVEEWGQVVIINMLTRYARTQFVDPNIGAPLEEVEERPFYDDEKSPQEEPAELMDPDYRLLLATAKPLLQSRNAAVVLAVAQLYQHIAPISKVSCIARALIRLLRSHREIQAVVLTNIATLSTQRKGMFEPFLKSFFVRSCDPTQIKILKLEVMTNLATDTNISLILKEFQTYIWSPDKVFVAAAIQAIGRCASAIKDVTDSCLNGLVMLLSNNDPLIVGESVVVVRKLLQTETVGHKSIISHMASLVDNIEMPTARASILWLLGEYCEKVPKIAPDVLRKMAKSFINESDIVKLQILTLATKLYLTNPKQTHLLCQYVFNLAKYDTNYDIRDRARFIRAIVFTTDKESKIGKQAKKIFLASKPPPVQQSTFKDRDHFQLGTLSHLINARATGYSDLPPFPDVAPDKSARGVKVPENIIKPKESTPFVWKMKSSKKEKSFYSDSEDNGSDSKDESSSEESESNSDTSSTGSSSDSSDESEASSSISAPRAKKIQIAKESVESDSEDSEDDSSSGSSDESESEDEGDFVSNKTVKKPLNSSTNGSEIKPVKSNLDLLLDLDSHSMALETPILTPSLGGFLSPDTSSLSSQMPNTSIKKVSPIYIPSDTIEILNRISSNGLSVNARFTRSPHLYSLKMTSIELTFNNSHPSDDFKDICIGQKKLSIGMTMHDFSPIPCLKNGSVLHGTIGIDFNDSIQPAHFEIVASKHVFPISITPLIGELICPVAMSESDFDLNQAKLCGMNEHSDMVFLLKEDSSFIHEIVFKNVNVAKIDCNKDGISKFSGESSSGELLVLIRIQLEKDETKKSKIVVNCERMVVASMVLKLLRNVLEKK